MTLNQLNDNVLLTHDILKNAQFTLPDRFMLNLSLGQTFFCDKLIRLVPKRRLIAFGTFQGKAVHAKIFFHYKRAKSTFDREILAHHALKRHHIHTPTLVHQDDADNKKIYVLLYERLFNVITLNDIWSARHSLEDIIPPLKQVVIEIAHQHQLGLVQNDISLVNYLMDKKTIYTIDCDKIASVDSLSRKMCEKNLALLFSWFEDEIENVVIRLYPVYMGLRKWSFNSKDIARLIRWSREIANTYQKRFLSKVLIGNSRYYPIKGKKISGVLDRRYSDDCFAQSLKQIDHLLCSSVNHKKRMMINNKEFMVVRFKNKNIFQWLASFFRLTPAEKVWRLAHRLYHSGTLIAKPVAFIKIKHFGFCSRSYFVSE